MEGSSAVTALAAPRLRRAGAVQLSSVQRRNVRRLLLALARGAAARAPTAANLQLEDDPICASSPSPARGDGEDQHDSADEVSVVGQSEESQLSTVRGDSGAAAARAPATTHGPTPVRVWDVCRVTELLSGTHELPWVRCCWVTTGAVAEVLGADVADIARIVKEWSDGVVLQRAAGFLRVGPPPRAVPRAAPGQWEQLRELLVFLTKPDQPAVPRRVLFDVATHIAGWRGARVHALLLQAHAAHQLYIHEEWCTLANSFVDRAVAETLVAAHAGSTAPLRLPPAALA